MSDQKTAEAEAAGPRAGTITLEQAGRLIKKSPQFVMQLRREGWIPKPPYTVVGVVHGYVDYKEDEARRTSKSAGATRAQDLRAEEVQLRMDEKRGVLKQQAEEAALALCDDVLGQLRSDLYAIPARVTKDLVLRRKFEGALDAALNDAATRAAGSGADRGEDPTEGGEAAAPSGTKRARPVGAKAGVSRKRGRAGTA